MIRSYPHTKQPRSGAIWIDLCNPTDDERAHGCPSVSCRGTGKPSLEKNHGRWTKGLGPAGHSEQTMLRLCLALLFVSILCGPAFAVEGPLLTDDTWRISSTSRLTVDGGLALYNWIDPPRQA